MFLYGTGLFNQLSNKNVPDSLKQIFFLVMFTETEENWCRSVV